MPKFIVTMKEVHSRQVLVEAQNEGQAIQAAHDGEYQEMRDNHSFEATEFDRVLPRSQWTVKADKPATKDSACAQCGSVGCWELDDENDNQTFCQSCGHRPVS